MNRYVRFNQAFFWLVFRIYLICSRSQYKTFLTKTDLRPDVGYIIAANHQRKLDPFVIGAALPFRLNRKLTPIWFMGYRELFSKWHMRTFLLAAGSFPTKPIRDLPYGLPFSTEMLAQHGTVCLFPEGRRVFEGRVEPKHGVRVLAELPHVELIPVHLQWHKKRFGERVEIVIGTPFVAAGKTPVELMDMIYSM